MEGNGPGVPSGRFHDDGPLRPERDGGDLAGSHGCKAELPCMSNALIGRRRFRRVDGTVLLIDATPLARMLSFRQTKRNDHEAGGVLLGRHLLEVPHIVVDEVTTPTREDSRLRAFFKRSRAPHQRVIDDRWATSSGTCQYLGEWHTHPEPVPHPSSVDMADWRRRLRTDTFDGDSLLFLIVGTAAICVWEGSRTSTALRPLTQLPEESL